MRKTGILILVAASVFLLLAVENAAAQEDTIIINIAGKHQRIERVTVGRETYRTVRYKVGSGASGSWQEESTENVVEIIHGAPPPKFTSAEAARKDGDWSKAVQDYGDCIQHERREWVKIYAQYFLAEAQRMWGQSDPAKAADAIKEYEVFISKYSDHRFIPGALYGKALAANTAGQGAKAKAAFDDLGSGKYGPQWEVRGQYGSAQLSGGSTAVTKLNQLIEKAKRLGMNDIVASARLGLAQALLNQQQFREAMTMFKDIVGDPEGVGKEVLASAHNGLGDCYSKLSSSQDDMKKALFEYLKVVVLYASARSEYLDALKKAISLLDRIGGDEYKKRAEDLRKEYEKASR